MDITKKVNSFEDACSVLNIDTNLPDFSMVPEKDRKPLIAHYKLTVICEALNDGWVPDWSNGDWDKWYPWFDMDDEGSSGRFSFYGSDALFSDSTVGSRLCFKSRELAEYAAKQFISIYKKVFTI